MANNYYATGTVASGGTSIVSIVETGLTAMGWTLVDTNGGHRVWRCPDVNGATGVYFFIDLFNNAGSLEIDCWRDWDSSAHVGLIGTASPAWNQFGGTYYLYVNKLCAVMCVADNIANPIFFFGQPRARQAKGVSDGMCLSTGSMAIGATTVNVNANLTGRLRVGQVVAIQNFAHNNGSANKANQELVTITAVGASSLSFSATTKAYDTGAKIGPPDMLCPVGAANVGIRSYSSGTLAMSYQGYSLNQAANATQKNIGPLNSWASATGAQANASTMNATGFAMESSSMGCSQSSASMPDVILGITGIIGVIPNYSGGNPADGSKVTDGLNVYVMPKGGTDPGGGAFTFCIGPTGDAVNLGTQKLILPLPLPATDSIYFADPLTPGPSNAFNQGLN